MQFESDYVGRRSIAGVKVPAIVEQALGNSWEAGYFPQGFTLITIVLDDSSSIQHSVGAICEAHNVVIRTACESPHADATMVQTLTIHNHYLNFPCPVKQAIRLNVESYPLLIPDTPLYDGVRIGLEVARAKVAETLSFGTETIKTLTVIITDGENNIGESTPAQVSELVKPLVIHPNHAVMGFGFGQEYQFRPIFQAMGLRTADIFAGANSQAIWDFLQRVLRRFQELGSG